MKITDIRVHILQSELEQPFAFSQGWVRVRSATIVEIHTNNGLIGWGEAFAQGLESPQIAASAIEYSLKPLILGQDPRNVEVLWHSMYNHTRDFGRKGSIIAAISGIDIALWDLLGKAYAAPVSQLIGGRFRSVVQPYATGFYRLNGQNEGDRLAEEAVAHIDAGFKAMKIKLGFGVNDDIKVMRQIGRAIEGRDVELMVDTNHAYGRTEALRLGRVLDEYDLRWYEEPVPAEDVGGYIELRQKLKTPIAGGENEHSIYGFRELLNCHAVDIVQPDIGSCGGVTGARHVIALAQANGIEVNPHVWGSGVAQAASLQVLAALPNAIHSLYSRQPILEYDRSSHPFRDDLVDRPLSLNTNGMVEISESPGLGVEVNRAILNKYKIN